MKRIMFIVAVTIIAIGCFMLFANSNHDHDHDAHGEDEHDEMVDFDNIPLTQQQMNNAGIKLGEMQRREMDATIQVNGLLVLRAQHMADVAPLMGGIVKAVLVKEGDNVHKGQVVAQIANTEMVALQREYFTACKEAETAELEWQRQQTLQHNGAGVKKTLQQAHTAYNIAHANATGIAQQLKQMGIDVKAVKKGKFATVFALRAPIGGTVNEMTARLGSYADMQTPLMKICDNAAVEADLNVFERDIAKVKAGDRVWLTLTNQPGSKISGQVYGINQHFNTGTKAVAAHVRLDPHKEATLFDGMYVQGSIATGRQMCNAVPHKGIVSMEGKSYVFLLNGKDKNGVLSFSRHEVKTGAQQDGYTEITPCSHMGKGKQVIVEGAYYLASMTSEHGEHNH